MISAGRRDAAVPHLVRLLRPAHPGGGAEEPDVRFAHCGGLWTEAKHPKNAGSYFGYIDECQYLNGVIAGHMTQEQQARLRRRQADPAGAAQHQRLHDGRAVGRSPKHHDDRDLHRRLVACRSRRPRPPTAWPTRASTSSRCTSTARRWSVETAAKRGKMVCGYHASSGQAGAQRLPHRRRVELDHRLQDHHRGGSAGKPHPNFVRGGLKDGLRQDARPTARWCTDAAKKNADDVQAKMLAGSFDIFTGRAEGQHAARS